MFLSDLFLRFLGITLSFSEILPGSFDCIAYHEKKIEASNEKAKEYIKTKRTKNVGIPLNIDELAAYIAGGSL